MTSDDLARRWREAKLGERVGGRVAVWVECDGDPRAEVLAAVDRVTAPEAEPDTVTIADPPPRRSRKGGAK